MTGADTDRMVWVAVGAGHRKTWHSEKECGQLKIAHNRTKKPLSVLPNSKPCGFCTDEGESPNRTNQDRSIYQAAVEAGASQD